MEIKFEQKQNFCRVNKKISYDFFTIFNFDINWYYLISPHQMYERLLRVKNLINLLNDTLL